jgi:hypothetical protein
MVRIRGIYLMATLSLVSCDREQEQEQVSDTVANSWKNELVRLKVRRMERADRMAVKRSPSIPVKVQQGALEDVWEGWPSERFSNAALANLEDLFDTEGIKFKSFADSFRGMSALPEDLRMISESASGITEWRSKEKVEWLDGPQFSKSVTLLLRRFPVRAELKIIEVRVDRRQLEVAVLAEHAGEGKEAHGRWSCLWELDGSGELRLLEMKLEDYLESRSESPAIFTEATGRVIGATPHFAAQVMSGIGQWAGRITRFGDMALTGHHGIAVGDVDGDGREDLFVCDGGSLPNRLYRQREDGTAEDISRDAGVDWLEDSRAGLLVDLDNDGDQDLVVATIAMVAFAENDGTGKFSIRGGFPGAQYPFSLCAADYDLDGDLDVYVCVYGEGDGDSGGRGFEARSPVPFENAQNGGSNVLLENLGGFGFADVTDKVGMGKHNTRWSFAASWEDYDRDGDPDLYVANDFGRNCLYRNDSGKFLEIGESAGVEDTAAGMSVSWGDYNNDGRFDLYIGNMFSAAGQRVAAQSSFAPGRSDNSIAGLRRMARGNSLFTGGGDYFTEVPAGGGSEIARWAWSSGFVDIDNDGWQDLVVANGYLTGWNRKDDL